MEGLINKFLKDFKIGYIVSVESSEEFYIDISGIRYSSDVISEDYKYRMINYEKNESSGVIKSRAYKCSLHGINSVKVRKKLSTFKEVLEIINMNDRWCFVSVKEIYRDKLSVELIVGNTNLRTFIERESSKISQKL